MKKTQTHKQRIVPLLLAFTMASLLLPMETYASSQPSVTIADKTVSGKVGEAMIDTILTFDLQNGEFEDIGGEDCSEWFTNLPSGLTATCDGVNEEGTAADVTITGTPTEKLSAPIEVDIAGRYIGIQGEITFTVNPNAKWEISSNIAETLSATIADKTVSGKVGEAIVDTRLTFNLQNAEFEDIGGMDCSEWFGNLPSGLTATCDGVNEEGTAADVTISGTPAEAMMASIVAVIPSRFIGNAGDASVAANPNAKWDISSGKTEALTASIDDVTVSGKPGEAIKDTKLVLRVTGAEFEDIGTMDCSTWFKNLPAGLKAMCEGVSQDGLAAEFTISGTPTANLNAPMEIIIPSAAVDNAGDITVTANANAKWAIGTAEAVTTPPVSTPTDVTNVPKTGDSSNIVIFLVFSSAAALALVVLFKKRANKAYK